MIASSPKHIAQALFESVSKSNHPNKVMNDFVDWLHKSGNWNKRTQIIGAFNEVEKANKKVISAKITTAREISTEQKNNILKAIKYSTKAREVNAEWLVEEDLIGGIKINFDGTVIDSSLKTNIKKLSNSFKS